MSIKNAIIFSVTGGGGSYTRTVTYPSSGT